MLQREKKVNTQNNVSLELQKKKNRHNLLQEWFEDDLGFLPSTKLAVNGFVWSTLLQ